MASTVTDAVQQEFLDWFARNGGWYHPSLTFAKDNVTGLSLFTTNGLEADTTIVRLPCRLALSPESCRRCLLDAYDPAGRNPAREPEYAAPNDWVVFYLFVAKLLMEDECRQAGSTSQEATKRKCSVSPAFEGLVSHWPYIAMLPEDILTPMQFSAVEVQLLEGTPLHSDALERRQDKLASFLRSMVWLRERRAASDDLVASTAISAALGPIGHESLSDLLSHQYQWGADTIRFPAFATWLWASTAYGSRSFPPKMVAQRAQPRHLVAPVLLPGIDAFNHARGVPVTWTSPCCPTKEPAKPAIPASGEAGASIEFEAAITIHSGVKAGEQVFNCYGGKSNEEFLAGYGFVVPGGPDDTLTLVLGGQVGPTSKQAPEPSGKSASHTDTADSSFSALTLRKPWGQRHYWTKPRDGISAAAAPAGLLIELRERLISGGQNDQGPSDSPPIELSWLLKPHTATPSLPSTPTEGGVGRNEDTGNQAKVAETVTSTLGKAALVARRKRRHQLEALHLDGEVLETLEELLCAKRKLFRSSQKTLESVLVEQNQAIIRPAVLRLVSVYREGQSMIFDQAVEWTRSKMDELVVLIEELETEVNN